jgi:hypothetical protein
MTGHDKSHVSMEQKVCVVCGKRYDTGAILLDRRLRDSMERHTVTGWGMCEEHEAMRADGYVALIGANPGSDEETIQPGEADRTGALVHLKREKFDEIFNVPCPDGMVCFVDPQVIEMFRRASGKEA